MCVERHPAPSISAPKSNMWPSITLRSSRLAAPKSTIAQKVAAALTELGHSTSLIMPTKTNLGKLDELQACLGTLVEVKKAVDRVQGEIRMVKRKRATLLGESEEPMIKGEEGEDGGSSSMRGSVSRQGSPAVSAAMAQANRVRLNLTSPFLSSSPSRFEEELD